MRPRRIEIDAPSRLHFGMLSFGQRAGRQFGGAGVMVARPALRLRISSSEKLEAHGPSAARAIQFARRVARSLGLAEEPRCRIEVLASPPEHVGLGSGTQLGMAVAAGVAQFCTGRMPTAVELAQAVGRGVRSAVGVHGFAHGGLIYEAGKTSDEEISPMVDRIALPEEWRFVLLRPAGQKGLSGDREREAFKNLPPVDCQTTDELRCEIESRLLPAAAAGCFETFSESLYRFGTKAGNCFAAYQGGPFAGPRLAELVEVIRSLGVVGVGQSSWGPTLFALLADEDQASTFVQRFSALPAAKGLHVTITPAANRGARVRVLEASEESTEILRMTKA